MILVTGASGFVGQHLCRRLVRQGEKVRALYFRTPPPRTLEGIPGLDWVCGDLLDVLALEEIIQGVRRVYHLAGKVSFQPRDRRALWEGNVMATQNLVNECLEQKVEKLVYLSSVAALVQKDSPRECIDESVNWEESGHYSLYGKTKHLAELEVWRGIAEGLPAIVLHPATILGEGDWNQGSCRLVKMIYEEFPFYTEGVTGWVDVQDVVEAAITAMNSNIHSERFILAEGNYSFRSIFTRLARQMDRRPPRWKAGALASALVWRWNALKSLAGARNLSLTRETAGAARRKLYFQTEKFREWFPDFRYTPMEATLERVAKAYLAQVKEGQQEKKF